MIEIKEIYRPLFGRDYSVLLYYGGRCGGKSYGVGDSYIHIARQEKRKILVCRETKQSMEKSIVALYRERIEHFGYSDFIIQKDYIKNRITGSEFYFVGLNDSQESFLQAIKSIPNIDDCIIEEAQSISARALEILIPTVKRNAKGSRLVAIWNPQTVEDPIWDLVENPRPRTYIKNVNYYDNSFCPPETIEEAELCKIHKPDKYRHVWLGEPLDRANNTVVKYFDKAKHIKAVNYYPSEPLHISCDFNVDPMSWVLAHKTDTKAYFIDEIVVENTNVRDTAKEFLDRYGFHTGEIIINGDASGDNRDAGSDKTKFVQLRNILYEYGYTNIRVDIKDGNPRIINRVDAFNSKMLTDAGEVEIYFSPKCKWLIYNCQKLCFKPGTSIIDVPTQTILRNDTNSKFLGHIYDAASYLVEYYWPVKDTRKCREPERELSLQEQFSKQGR